MNEEPPPDVGSCPSALRPPPSALEVFAWAMYDWANSAYSTLLITVVLHYVQEVVLPDRRGPAVFAWCIGAAMLVAAVLSPAFLTTPRRCSGRQRGGRVDALGGDDER